LTRHGWPDPDRQWWQGAQPHGPLPYGHGGKTVGQWGCTVCSLAAAARLAGATAGASPEWLQARAMRPEAGVWAPGSSLAVLPSLARAADLTCPDVGEAWSVRAIKQRPAMTVREISVCICDTIDHHGLTAPVGFGWLHVDYTGDDVGEHWILAYAYDDKHIYCYDSAVAGIVRLSRKTLTGAAQWGSVERRYRVVRGYPLGV
jgi:hypothetical protein